MMRTSNEYGLTTSEGIRLFLEFWPKFKDEFIEVLQSLPNNESLLFSKDVVDFNWCHLYELPIKQHIAVPLTGLLQDEKLLRIFQELASSKNQVAFVPELITQIDSYFDALEPPSETEKKELIPLLAAYFSLSLSIYHSLRCVLYHGCFLNELIERVRTGDDKALFDAVRLDPTVIGCKSVLNRISKATLLQDKRFIAKLKAALNGNIAKREQANYQKMRLVLEILYESQATRLDDDQLYQLFVEELKLYSWNERGGGNAKALRKFADTYMKKQATT
jgi:hypothetical protein